MTTKDVWGNRINPSVNMWRWAMNCFSFETSEVRSVDIVGHTNVMFGDWAIGKISNG
jgi:hypothetical protein